MDVHPTCLCPHNCDDECAKGNMSKNVHYISAGIFQQAWNTNGLYIRISPSNLKCVMISWQSVHFFWLLQSFEFGLAELNHLFSYLLYNPSMAFKIQWISKKFMMKNNFAKK
jgi:hypothetical protein